MNQNEIKSFSRFGDNNIVGSFSCITCLPKPSQKEKVIDEVSREFEVFFVKEFLKDALVMSGELSEKYGYFYKDIVIETLARSANFGVSDMLKKAISNNLEFLSKGFITSEKQKISRGKF
jgi:hypothetical protein